MVDLLDHNANIEIKRLVLGLQLNKYGSFCTHKGTWLQLFDGAASKIQTGKYLTNLTGQAESAEKHNDKKHDV